MLYIRNKEDYRNHILLQETILKGQLNSAQSAKATLHINAMLTGLRLAIDALNAWDGADEDE